MLDHVLGVLALPNRGTEPRIAILATIKRFSYPPSCIALFDILALTALPKCPTAIFQ